MLAIPIQDKPSRPVPTGETVFGALFESFRVLSTEASPTETTPEATRTPPLFSEPWVTLGYTTGDQIAVNQKFRELRDQWLTETAHLSKVKDRVASKHYHRIMAMGPVALPLLFAELRAGRWHWWFWALEQITGAEGVVPEDKRGDVPEMVAHWLRWADSNGY